jgi:hypothetical protein
VTADIGEKMHNFNPFQKAFGEITSSDLVVLKTLSEGWYAEYKQSQAGTSTIAKSISAFANTYGGWLFYGIVEDKKGQRTAEAFPGIPNSEVPQYEEWMTQAAARHLSPPAFFEHRILYGPEPAIGLPEGHAVIMVHVPPGNDAQYIHSSGRIYRRVADASDPTHETDRHFLDLLWKRGDDARARFRKYFEKERPDAEDVDKGCAYLKLHFFADPWGERSLESNLTFRKFAEIMNNPDPLPFDSTYTSATGFVARQTRDNDCWRNVFKWEYRPNCVQEITVPLTTSYIEGPEQVPIFLDGYDTRDGFSLECYQKQIRFVHVVDLSLLFELLLSIFQRLYDLNAADRAEWPLWMKAQLFGIKRHVPFLDTEDYLNFVKRYGFPVVQDNDAVIPYGLDPDSCIDVKPSKPEVPVPDDLPERFQFSVTQAWATTFTIGRAFGIPTIAFGSDLDFASGDIADGVSVVTGNLLGMGKKAREAAALRRNRKKRTQARH